MWWHDGSRRTGRHTPHFLHSCLVVFGHQGGSISLSSMRIHDTGTGLRAPSKNQNEQHSNETNHYPNEVAFPSIKNIATNGFQLLFVRCRDRTGLALLLQLWRFCVRWSEGQTNDSYNLFRQNYCRASFLAWHTRFWSYRIT